MRDAVSLHVVAPVRGIGTGWLASQDPPTLGEALGRIRPTGDEGVGAWLWLPAAAAGVFRAVVVGLCWLVASSVADRRRAGIGLVVVVVATVAGWIVRTTQGG